MPIGIALKSLLSRRLVAGLMIAGIALSTAMLLAAENKGVDTRASFCSAAAGGVLIALLGMLAGMFATLDGRHRELAVLRSAGARPFDIAVLLVAESTLIGLAGAVSGYVLLTLVALTGSGGFGTHPGIVASIGLPSLREAGLLGAIVAAAMLAGILPAWRAWRLSLRDGLAGGA